jgi:hypothetical protein
MITGHVTTFFFLFRKDFFVLFKFFYTHWTHAHWRELTVWAYLKDWDRIDIRWHPHSDYPLNMVDIIPKVVQQRNKCCSRSGKKRATHTTLLADFGKMRSWQGKIFSWTEPQFIYGWREPKRISGWRGDSATNRTCVWLQTATHSSYSVRI